MSGTVRFQLGERINETAFLVPPPLHLETVEFFLLLRVISVHEISLGDLAQGKNKNLREGFDGKRSLLGGEVAGY